MQVVKALAQECVRNKQWNEAFVAALKELGVDVEIPVNDAAKYVAAHKEDAVVEAAAMFPVSSDATDDLSGAVAVHIGVNPASNLPKGSDLIGVECYVWGACREINNELAGSFCDRGVNRPHRATLTAYHPERGYSWGTESSWFDNAVPVWFGEPGNYVEVTEGNMIREAHQFWIGSRTHGEWNTVYGLEGVEITREGDNYIVRARRDGRNF